MIITALILLLLSSFTVHLVFVYSYSNNKSKGAFRGFVVTAGSNVSIMALLSIAFFKYPVLVQKLDVSFLLWILSGFLFLILFLLQLSVLLKIFIRSRDPENFERNFFGKKVYKESVVKKSEYGIFMGSLPFLLLIGAYFFARLINYFLYGKL